MSHDNPFESAIPDAPDGVEYCNERPEPGECDLCGGDVMPQRHPFRGGVWIAPVDVCRECAEKAKREQLDRQRNRERFMHKWRKASEVPKLLRSDAENQDIDLKPPLQNLIDTPPDVSPTDWWGVFLHGDVGTGKSVQGALTLAMYLKRWVLEEGYHVSAKYCDVTDLLDRIQESWDTPGESVTLKPYIEADLLIMDDIGREQGTEWSAGKINRLVNMRHVEKRPTVFISNFSLLDLQSGEYSGGFIQEANDARAASHSDIDARIIDRIWQTCGGTRERAPTVIHCDTHYRSPRGGQP